MLLFNEIFESGKWGVTIGIRAGWSVQPNRESSDVVLELEYYNCIILTYGYFVEN